MKRELPKLPGVQWENDYRHGRGARAAVANWSAFLAQAEAMFAAAPVTEIRFCGMTDETARKLAASPFLEKLSVLHLGPYWGDYDQPDVLHEPNRIGVEGIRALASSPFVKNLCRLDLSENAVGDAGAEALAGSVYLDKLVELSLGGGGVGPSGAESLVKSRKLPQLKELILPGNHLGDEGLQAVAAASYLKRLRLLALGNNGIGDLGARALADSPFTAGLGELFLSENRITYRGALALVESPSLQRLERLELNRMEGRGISRKEAETLKQSFRGKEFRCSPSR